ncbi:MAG: hypothetical protein CSA65_09325 [Proteobacteria bacterium]|nr:MAG: hypothetical protein CSA65_09325 [Pseudomonadota bacterium]
MTQHQHVTRWANAWLLCLLVLAGLAAGCRFALTYQGDHASDGAPISDVGSPSDGAPSFDARHKDGSSDPCSNVSCTKPPAPTCLNDKVLERYDNVGTCVAGTCTYGLKTETCAGSCVSGSCLSSATFLHVDASSSGAEQGTAKAPYRSISAAVSAASNNTAILVAKGNYNEKVSINGKVIELIGGYPGGGDFGSRDPATNVTRITPSSGPALRLQNAASTLVAGFTITAGSGRGVHCSGGAPTIANCNISDNEASSSDGAGVFTSSCDLTLRDSVVANNVGRRGGGIATEGGTLMIERCLIRDNEGRDDHGGGMYLTTGTVTVRDNRIEGNVIGADRGYSWGGGLILVNCQGTLRGNVVTRNRAVTFGSGVFIDDGTTATLENELYFANVCAEGGTAVYVDGLSATVHSKATLTNVSIVNHGCSNGVGHAVLVEESDVVVKNSILWNNGGDEVSVSGGSFKATYTNASKKLNGAGNLKVNPGFAGSGAGAYHLRSTVGRWDGGKWVKDASDSPCLDSADTASGVGAEPAPNGGRGNLGAFGRTSLASKS